LKVIFGKKTYTVTATCGPGGTISPAGVTTVIGNDRSLTYTISPAVGATIAAVVVDNKNLGPLARYTFSDIEENHTIAASFTQAAANYSITASTDGNASISPAGTTTVSAGGSQTFTISVNSGYSVQSVLVDGVNQGALSSYTFTNVQANHTISVSSVAIVPGPFTITSSTDGNATISPLGATLVQNGGSQTYTIAANAGYVIASVLVDGVDQGALSSYTFTNVQANHLIAVATDLAPAPGPFDLVASADSHATISPSGTTSVAAGGSQTYTITPDYGWKVVSVSVDGVDQSALSSYTFTNVQAGHTIAVTTALITYQVTVNVASTLDATPVYFVWGYSNGSSYTGGGTQVTSGKTYTVAMLNAGNPLYNISFALPVGNSRPSLSTTYSITSSTAGAITVFDDGYSYGSGTQPDAIYQMVSLIVTADTTVTITSLV
jgi:hypothetical protein